MKVNGNGQGKILTPEELRRLFTEGFTSPRDGREANRQGHRALPVTSATADFQSSSQS